MRAALSWIQTRRTQLFAALFISVIACFLFLRVAYAQDVEGATNFILTKLVELIQWLISLVGALILFLVSLLVSVAKYNEFTTAYPVQTGWVLVRDVVNMFFIVVLLLIAFGTIIGYEPFHYKKYLPKLLLMAVLINFSKTLVGVLIDFSQVIMLTFVNGFQAAAGGNFITALKLTKVTELGNLKVESSEPKQTLSNLFIASLLGLGMLMVSASVLLVMIIYMLVRIIGLWITLILSPIAFFALALPDKMKNAVSVFTNEWWKRLSALLTGGPIVAFFLWLSLATVQGSPDTFAKMYQSQSEKEAQSLSVAITRAGEPAELSSFVVAIVMLMMGLSAAVSITGQVSTQALPAAKAVGGLVFGAAKFAAKTGVRAGAGAARGTAAGARGVARYVDRRAGVSEALGRAGLAAAARVGGSRIPGAGLLGERLARTGAGLVRGAATRRAAEGAELEELGKGLPPADRLNFMRAMTGANASRMFGNPERAEEANKRALEVQTSKAGLNMAKKDAEKEWLAQNVVGRAATNDDRDKAKAYADARAKRVSADANIALQDIAQRRGDEKKLEDLKEAQSKDPSMYNKLSDLSRVAGNKIDDYKQAFKDVKSEAWQDSGTFLAYMKASGLVNNNGTMTDGYEETEAWRELIGHGGNRAQYAQAHAFNLKTTGGQNAAEAQILAMNAAATPAQIDAAAAARYNVSIGQDGQNMVYANVNPGGRVDLVSMAEIENRPRQMANFAHAAEDLPQAVRANLQNNLQAAGVNVDTFGQRFERPIPVEAANIMAANAGIYGQPAPAGGYDLIQVGNMAQAQALGASSAAAFNYDRAAGQYISPASQDAHAFAYEGAAGDLSSNDVNRARVAMSFIANTDVSAIKQGGQMADVVTKGLEGHMEAVSKNLKAAGREQRQKIEQLVKEINASADKALAKAATQALTAAEQRMVNLKGEITKDKTLNRMAGGKK